MTDIDPAPIHEHLDSLQVPLYDGIVSPQARLLARIRALGAGHAQKTQDEKEARLYALTEFRSQVAKRVQGTWHNDEVAKRVPGTWQNEENLLKALDKLLTNETALLVTRLNLAEADLRVAKDKADRFDQLRDLLGITDY